MATNPEEFKLVFPVSASTAYERLEVITNYLKTGHIFNFANTHEGAAYWTDVYERLVNMRKAVYTGELPSRIPLKELKERRPGDPLPVSFDGPAHLLWNGYAACNFTTRLIAEWPNGHHWFFLKDRINITCVLCKAKAEEYAKMEAEQAKKKAP